MALPINLATYAVGLRQNDEFFDPHRTRANSNIGQSSTIQTNAALTPYNEALIQNNQLQNQLCHDLVRLPTFSVTAEMAPNMTGCDLKPYISQGMN